MKDWLVIFTHTLRVKHELEIAAVFIATIGLLVNEERYTVTEWLRDGEMTQQKFRGVIVREIEETKSRLDGLARKDLLASIS